jgi:hypothetical protein
MTTIHEWDENGKHFKAVLDDLYSTRGSYAVEWPDHVRTWSPRYIFDRGYELCAY